MIANLRHFHCLVESQLQDAKESPAKLSNHTNMLGWGTREQFIVRETEA
jgi:hypothetical protein